MSRVRNGQILHRFPSWLPNGSRSTQAGSEHYCILDCIFHELDDTYYLLDVMCWKGYSLYDCSTEFRLYWREAKLQEETGSALSGHNLDCRYKIVPVPAFHCDPGTSKALQSSEGLKGGVACACELMSKDTVMKPCFQCLCWAAKSPWSLAQDAKLAAGSADM